MRAPLRDWTHETWAGACALALSLGLALGWVVGVTFMAVRGRPLGEAAATVMSTLGGAIVGAIATYLGAALPHRRNNGATPPKPPDL